MYFYSDYTWGVYVPYYMRIFHIRCSTHTLQYSLLDNWATNDINAHNSIVQLKHVGTYYRIYMITNRVIYMARPIDFHHLNYYTVHSDPFNMHRSFSLNAFNLFSRIFYTVEKYERSYRIFFSRLIVLKHHLIEISWQYHLNYYFFFN